MTKANVNSTTSSKQIHWVDVRSVQESQQTSLQFLDICQRHALNKKWVLLINPDGQSLTELNKLTDCDTSKVLTLHASKTPVSFNNIKAALSNGNCAAVVLCNACLSQQEIAELQQIAYLGQTECIVLNKATTLH